MSLTLTDTNTHAHTHIHCVSVDLKKFTWLCQWVFFSRHSFFVLSHFLSSSLSITPYKFVNLTFTESFSPQPIHCKCVLVWKVINLYDRQYLMNLVYHSLGVCEGVFTLLKVGKSFYLDGGAGGVPRVLIYIWEELWCKVRSSFEKTPPYQTHFQRENFPNTKKQCFKCSIFPSAISCLFINALLWVFFPIVKGAVENYAEVVFTTIYLFIHVF